MNDIIFRVIVPDNKILFKTLMLKGERGDDGVSIVSFEKTQTIGLTDYYTITLNDGTTYEFTVQNGTNAYFDDELSLLSENAVQNKIITAAINSINAALVSIQQYDAALSGSSENAVQNKVVKSAIDSINSAIALLGQYDSALSDSSENAVQNKVVKAALDLKANLTALNDYYTKTEIDNTINNLGASGVSYNNASSGLSATDAQAAIDEVTSEINNLDASDIPYNNTSSGLSATDTQEAIDELAQGFSPTSLSDLSDTTITNPQANQVLAYDGDNWVNSGCLEFQKGDTFNLENIWCCGYQGNSSTRAFFIPLPKEYSSSLTVSVTAVVSAYTFSGASETWNNNTLSSLGTVSYLKARNGVVVLVALTTPASTTQYTPLTVRIASGTLTFS